MYGWKAEEAKSEKPRPRLIVLFNSATKYLSLYYEQDLQNMHVQTHLRLSPVYYIVLTSLHLRSPSGARRMARELRRARSHSYTHAQYAYAPVSIDMRVDIFLKSSYLMARTTF